MEHTSVYSGPLSAASVLSSLLASLLGLCVLGLVCLFDGFCGLCGLCGLCGRLRLCSGAHLYFVVSSILLVFQPLLEDHNRRTHVYAINTRS
jgi:hypothetical protein